MSGSSCWLVVFLDVIVGESHGVRLLTGSVWTMAVFWFFCGGQFSDFGECCECGVKRTKLVGETDFIY